MKKLFTFSILLFLLSGFTLLFSVDSKIFDVNKISTYFRNNGSFNRDPVTGNSGFEWPKGSGKNARYASGVWIGCIMGSDTLNSISEYAYDYLPGYIDNAGNPQGQNDPNYRIYTIKRGDTTSIDYLNWPFNQGAYASDNGKPLMMGDETMFYSYHDGYGHTSGSTSALPLKVQILQTNWAYDTTGHLSNTIFSEYKIINRNNAAWTNAYIAFWTDDDLGNATDDAVGVDSARSLGYTYNFTNNDTVYGTAPPAVGTVMLRGALAYTGNNSDTAAYFNPPGSNRLVKKIGYKQLGLTAHNTYNNGTPPPVDPHNYIEVYRVISGKWRTGENWYYSGVITKFPYNGDPVTGSGWNMTGGDDRRNLIITGPITMNPGDTQSVIIAQIIARGTSNLSSITKLREGADYLKALYNVNMIKPLGINNSTSSLPDKFKLIQNYPNPFNPSTTIEVQFPETGKGKLVIYDVLGKVVSILFNGNLSAGIHKFDFNGAGLPSGIYYYKFESEKYNKTLKMILLK
jgi:hypothetical protein